MSVRYVPHKYQEKAIQFMVERPCAGLFLAPGLGKTSITYATIKILQRVKMVKAVLVIAPLRPCYLVWPKEQQKWEQFRDMKVEILHGPDKQAALLRKADVYVINPEGLKWLSSMLVKMGTYPFDMLVIDESTRFKHTNTQRFKTIKPLLPKFKRRYILTGTPTPNGLMDIFGQMYCMDLGATFGPYVTHFRTKYFQQDPHSEYTWSLQKDAEARIHRAIAPRVLQMKAEDYLELPELVFNDIWVDLPPPAMKIYKQMEKQFFMELSEGEILASNAAGASNKCCQIASGGVYTSDDEWEHIHDAKTEALEELIEELSGSPALVMYGFKHDLERIRKVIGKDAPYIGGGKSTPHQIREIEDLWNAGKISVLPGQPQSMALGLNMQEAGNNIICYTLTWNAEDYEQFIKRMYRQGQKAKRVTVHRILARNTMDEAKVKALALKERGQNALFAAISDYWKGKK